MELKYTDPNNPSNVSTTNLITLMLNANSIASAQKIAYDRIRNAFDNESITFEESEKLRKQVSNLLDSGSLSHFDKTPPPTSKKDGGDPDYKEFLEAAQKLPLFEAILNYLSYDKTGKRAEEQTRKSSKSTIEELVKSVSDYKLEPSISDAYDILKSELTKSNPDLAVVNKQINVLDRSKSNAAQYIENVSQANHLRNLAQLRKLSGKSTTNLTQAQKEFLNQMQESYNISPYGYTLSQDHKVKSFDEIKLILDSNRFQIRIADTAAQTARNTFMVNLKKTIIAIMVSNFDLKKEIKQDSFLSSVNTETLELQKKIKSPDLKSFDDPFSGDNSLLSQLSIEEDGSDIFSGGVLDDEFEMLLNEFKAGELEAISKAEDNKLNEPSPPVQKQKASSPVKTKRRKRRKRSKKQSTDLWVTSDKPDVSKQIDVSSANLGRLLIDLSSRLGSQDTTATENKLLSSLSQIAADIDTIRKEVRETKNERAIRVKGKRTKNLLIKQKDALESAKNNPTKILTEKELDTMIKHTDDEIKKFDALTS